jgi:hypothetical protein
MDRRKNSSDQIGSPVWSRPLRRPLTIPTVMDLVILTDVRALLGHLPKQSREKSTWQHIAAELDKAAAGGATAGVSVALRIGVITNEGIGSTA